MKAQTFINQRTMRFIMLIALAAMLTLLAPAQTTHAAGLVSVCDEASLRAALLGGGTVTFSCSGTITLSSMFIVNTNVTLDGAGQSVTISGGNAVQVFTVFPGVTLNLQNITVANGHLGYAGGIGNLVPSMSRTALS